MSGPGPAPGRLGVWWLVAAGFAVGLVAVVAGHLRAGGYIVAATLGLGGLLRLVLPQRRAAALVVRSRGYDVVAWVGLAVTMAVVVWAVDLRPR